MAREIEIYQGTRNTTISGYCTATGSLYSVTVPNEAWDRWRAPLTDQSLSDVMPWLNKDERRFILYHQTPGELRSHPEVNVANA
jgi:hypothetical protein